MDESLGLRLALSHGLLTEADAEAALTYTSPVALFASGQEAADHGLAEIRSPGPAVARAHRAIIRKRSRSSTTGDHHQ